MVKILEFRSPKTIQVLKLQEIVNGETGELTKWFSKNQGARARFRIRVGHMQKIPRAEWNRKWFHGLDGGISEIKWSFGGKQFRALGFDSDGAFLMLIGCTH